MGRSAPGDVIWTTYAAPLIVHDRVLEILRTLGATGWTTFPVEVLNKVGEPVAPYHGLGISGRCGVVDLTRSPIELREYPGGWVPHFKGHYFIPDTWDGSDLFMEAPDATDRRTTHRFVTRRVKEALDRAKVRNLSLTCLPDLNVDATVYRISQPHLLPSDFEQRLAAAYAAAGVPRPKWL